MQYEQARCLVGKILELVEAEREVNHFTKNAVPGRLEAEAKLEGVAQDLQIMLVEYTDE